MAKHKIYSAKNAGRFSRYSPPMKEMPVILMVELAYTTSAPTALLSLGGMCWRQGFMIQQPTYRSEYAFSAESPGTSLQFLAHIA